MLILSVRSGTYWMGYRALNRNQKTVVGERLHHGKESKVGRDDMSWSGVLDNRMRDCEEMRMIDEDQKHQYTQNYRT
jgi:hypothetical protein